MQTDYAPERLHTDVPSKEALLAAAQDGSILQATAARCGNSFGVCSMAA